MAKQMQITEFHYTMIQLLRILIVTFSITDWWFKVHNIYYKLFILVKHFLNLDSQMGFEPTTLCDLVGYSTTELLETLW